jgi:hypothetical protein
MFTCHSQIGSKFEPKTHHLILLECEVFYEQSQQNQNLNGKQKTS